VKEKDRKEDIEKDNKQQKNISPRWFKRSNEEEKG
jgi:hypothetical protein